jgi:hypothetical protein
MQFRRSDFADLSYFLEIARHRNFRRAGTGSPRGRHLARLPAGSSRTASLSSGSFGREVREAMTRASSMVEDGFARREGQRAVFVRDLLETSRRWELQATGPLM